MKYRIEISGRGGEIVAGRVSTIFYNQFEDEGLDFEEYAYNFDYFDENEDVEIPENIRPFEPGEYHECDDLAHAFGSDTEDTFITVTDEEENILLDNASFTSVLKNGVDQELEDDVYPQDILTDGEAYFVAQSYEKGLFYSYEVETDMFDLNKLAIVTCDVDGWQLVTGVKYDGIELEDLGEGSTNGKGFDATLNLVVNED